MSGTPGARAASFVEPYRMLADGLPYRDVAEATDGIEDIDQWLDYWERKGHTYEELGSQAVADGLSATGGELLWLGCMSHHYGQHMAFDRGNRREAGQREKVRIYRLAAPHLLPPAERVEFTADGVSIAGFLRLPEPAPGGPPPCAMLLGGLESTKEEGYLMENRFLARRVATFAFDGPGQGETWFHRKLAENFETYTSAALDVLESHGLVDRHRVGVLGRSLGGHYAIRAAASDHRFRAAVCWGGCFDMTDFDQWPTVVKTGFAYVADRSIQDTRSFLLETHTLAGVAERVTAPVLVVHGREDAIFSMRQVAKFSAAMGDHPTLLVVDKANHCCHNLAHIVRPQMVEWLVEALKPEGTHATA
jgi:2,6-dihydroxypseudooxynicotine hydrolase